MITRAMEMVWSLFLSSFTVLQCTHLFALTGTYTPPHYNLRLPHSPFYFYYWTPYIYIFLLSLYTFIFMFYIPYIIPHFIPRFISLTYSHCILTLGIPVSHLFRFQLLHVVLLCQFTHCSFSIFTASTINYGFTMLFTNCIFLM
jgi:hypothetical protein